MADQRTGSHDSYALSGALVALGSIVLFIGTLFYIRLTQELGLPTAPAYHLQALADARALGPRPMFLAGAFAFFGDVFLTAGCIALITRRRIRQSDLELFGWTLVAMGAAVAMVFDSMMAVLLAPLAQLSDPGVFVAFKGWFDLLFASGNVPYGIGAIAVLVADMRAELPLLPRALAAFGIAVGTSAARATSPVCSSSRRRSGSRSRSGVWYSPYSACRSPGARAAGSRGHGPPRISPPRPWPVRPADHQRGGTPCAWA